MGLAADDLDLDMAEGEGPRKKEPKRDPGRLRFSGGRAKYDLDRDSDITVKGSVGKEEGKFKIRKLSIEYRKEF
jgi:hypothetical protein